MKYWNFKYYIILGLALNVSLSKAQLTGIGTKSPNQSTVLDVNSAVKTGGLLLPRLSLLSNQDVTTVPTPAAGLIVYNLNNNGSGNNKVEANRFYFWNGTKWIYLVDRQLVRRLLLPPVFFAQCEGNPSAINITGANLTALNNGTGYVIPFPTSSVIVNNLNNITLNSNNTFSINSAGSYEISAFINYLPNIINGYDIENTYADYNNARTSLEYRIQKSINGSTWTTVATTRSTWNLLTGAYFRNVVMPPIIIQNLAAGEFLRLVIARPDNYGGAHGNDGSNTSEISVGEGTVITRNIRILKVN